MTNAPVCPHCRHLLAYCAAEPCATRLRLDMLTRTETDVASRYMAGEHVPSSELVAACERFAAKYRPALWRAVHGGK